MQWCQIGSHSSIDVDRSTAISSSNPRSYQARRSLTPFSSLCSVQGSDKFMNLPLQLTGFTPSRSWYGYEEQLEGILPETSNDSFAQHWRSENGESHMTATIVLQSWIALQKSNLTVTFYPMKLVITLLLGLLVTTPDVGHAAPAQVRYVEEFKPTILYLLNFFSALWPQPGVDLVNLECRICNSHLHPPGLHLPQNNVRTNSFFYIRQTEYLVRKIIE